MMVELLNGVAGAGSAPVGPSDDWGHVFVAMSLATLGDPEQLKQRAQEIIDRLTRAETKDGSPIRIPGHNNLATRDAALAKGTVDIDGPSYDRLVELVGA